MSTNTLESNERVFAAVLPEVQPWMVEACERCNRAVMHTRDVWVHVTDFVGQSDHVPVVSGHVTSGA